MKARSLDLGECVLEKDEENQFYSMMERMSKEIDYLQAYTPCYLGEFRPSSVFYAKESTTIFLLNI
jgi:hypothetical protein